MAFTPEPADLQSENELRDKVVEEIEAMLNHAGPNYKVLKGFGLDIAVLIFRGYRTQCKFIEVKAFKGQRPQGVGFGEGRTGGNQVELLMMEERFVKSLDGTVRWVLADLTKDPGEKRYAMFSSMTAREAAMGGVRKGKQNNFNVRKLMQEPGTWDDLSLALSYFLTDQGD